MTKSELAYAVQMARCGDVGDGSMQMLEGFGLPDFPPTCVTLCHLAALIRWQCIQLNGEIDNAALDEIWKARRKIIVIVDSRPDLIVGPLPRN